jgi:nicotinamide-nucleotide amidase
MFESRGRPMAENNLRQADVPVGASIIEQRRGTAPGLICPVTVRGDDGEPIEKVMYAVPGVPHEMTEMMERAILPDLRLRAGEPSTILSRTLRTWGESESGLAERLADRIAELDDRGNPTLAFLASGIEGLKVRVTAKGPDEVACRELLAHEEGVLRALLGDIVFGVDDEPMEIAVGSLLDAKGLSLGLAESGTGGLLGARLTAAPGASTWFRGSVVSYASEVKYDLLGVPEGPVVSAPSAEAMALGARKVLGSDVGLAVTGVAGPAGQEGVDPGTVFVGLALDDVVESRQVHLPGDRQRVREFAVITALDLLRHRLLQRDAGLLERDDP